MLTFRNLVLFDGDSKLLENDFVDEGLDLFLIESEYLSVLKLIFFGIVEDRAVFVHKVRLYIFKLFFDDDVLQCSHNCIEVNIFWG